MDAGDKTVVMDAGQLQELLEKCRKGKSFTELARLVESFGSPDPLPDQRPPDQRPTSRPPPEAMRPSILSSLPPLELEVTDDR